MLQEQFLRESRMQVAVVAMMHAWERRDRDAYASFCSPDMNLCIPAFGLDIQGLDAVWAIRSSMRSAKLGQHTCVGFTFLKAADCGIDENLPHRQQQQQQQEQVEREQCVCEFHLLVDTQPVRTSIADNRLSRSISREQKQHGDQLWKQLHPPQHSVCAATFDAATGLVTHLRQDVVKSQTLTAEVRMVLTASAMLRAWQVGDLDAYASCVTAQEEELVLVAPFSGLTCTHRGLKDVWAVRCGMGEEPLPQYALDSFTFPQPGVLHCKVYASGRWCGAAGSTTAGPGNEEGNGTEQDQDQEQERPASCTLTFDSAYRVIRHQQELLKAHASNAVIKANMVMSAVAMVEAWVDGDKDAFLAFCDHAEIEMQVQVQGQGGGGHTVRGMDKVWEVRGVAPSDPLPQHVCDCFVYPAPKELHCAAHVLDAKTGEEVRVVQFCFHFCDASGLEVSRIQQIAVQSSAELCAPCAAAPL